MFAEKILQRTSLMIDMRMWPTAVIRIFTSVGCLWVLKPTSWPKDQTWTLDPNVSATSNVPVQSEQFEFQPVTGKDVANVILILPSNKAPGFSKIPARTHNTYVKR